MSLDFKEDETLDHNAYLFAHVVCDSQSKSPSFAQEVSRRVFRTQLKTGFVTKNYYVPGQRSSLLIAHGTILIGLDGEQA